jgi:sugar lactone lactonase YvrE
MRRIRILVLSVAALLLVVVLAACSSTPATGSLLVTVNGLPSGVNGVVTVTGPGGYTQAVTATNTLSNLALGTYSVAVGAASDGNTIVPVMYDGSASSSTVTVTANTTSSATVSYALRVGSGHLWLPLSTGVGAYQHDTLAATSSTGPDVLLSSVVPSNSEAVAVDHAGNLWVVDVGGYLDRFDAASLATSGSPSPAVTLDITATSTTVLGMAFDATGDLWVGDPGHGRLLMFTPAQLAGSGSPAPAVMISTNGASISGPFSLAFDASGDLWVANSSNSTLVAFTPAQLAATGNPAPSVTIGADATPSLSDPYAIAFDASGGLWAANAYGTISVVHYDASQLTSSGNPTPTATIGSASLGTHPEGLAFDASGALWVADYGSADLRRFTNPSSLSGSVTPTPDVIISPIGNTDVENFAFSPPAPGLPINTP